VAALDFWKPAGFNRIAGLTEQDISTTKGSALDWGIFGYGQIGGDACVISGFRLGKGTDAAGRARRLAWTVTHELGHTFGLEHCPVAGCLMEDAAGKAATLDRSSGLFCPRCKSFLIRQGIATR
jgi:archaemetzincin